MNFLFSFVFLTLISCGKTPSAGQNQKTVLVSLAPYQKIVQRIGGNTFLTQTIVPPGSNPHVYEPTTRQLKILEGSTVWFRLGEPFERKVLPWLQEKNGELIDVDLRQKVELISGSCCSHTEQDRHLWLSPKAMIAQIDLITAVLSKTFPENTNLYEMNGTEIKNELLQLDREIQLSLKDLPNRSFLVSHPAFAYFCKEYDLHQISIEHDGKEPTIHYLKALMEEAMQSKPRVAFAMPQHSNKGLELVAKKLGLQVRIIDPYGLDPFDTMQTLTDLLVSGEDV